jgi:DNA-binding CsgD family transcriptional regulator
MPVLAYAAAHPERVIAIVLREGYARGSDAGWSDLPLDLARDNWELFLRSLADRTINLVTVSGLGTMHELMRQTATRDTFIRYVEQWQTWDVSDLLDRVTMPVLVINDSGVHRKASRALAAALPRGSLVSNEVPRGAHSPSADAFRAFLGQAFMAEAAAAGPLEAQAPVDPGLSPREIEVLKLVVAGKSGREIAEELVLSPRTVERHIANIYRKTGTHGRAQLAGFALRRKLA